MFSVGQATDDSIYEAAKICCVYTWLRQEHTHTHS